MIEIDKLSVVLGGKTILHDISMTAMPGQLTVIVGPNGSGKSMLLKAMCGDLPGRGSIHINGRDIARMKPREAAILRAVLPQASMLSFPFTVHEVVSLGLNAGCPGRGELHGDMSLPERALALVDLAGLGSRLYQELSGGEQQRVHLARVLCQIWEPLMAGEPRWLILDEPVSSLDIRHQLLVMKVARDYARAGGGVIAVLHDLNLTAMFADRIAVLGGGRLAAIGAPDEVMTDAVLSNAYQCGLRVSVVPAQPIPFVLPQSACGVTLSDAGAGRDQMDCPAGPKRKELAVPLTFMPKRAATCTSHVRHRVVAARGPVLALLCLLASSLGAHAQEMAPDTGSGFWSSTRPDAMSEAPAIPRAGPADTRATDIEAADTGTAPAPGLPTIPAGDVAPAPGTVPGDRTGSVPGVAEAPIRDTPARDTGVSMGAAGGTGTGIETTGLETTGLETTGTDVAGRDEGGGRIAGRGRATMPHDLSPWGMFMAADRVVKAVMIGLALASLLSWTIWLAKWAELVVQRRATRRVLAHIRPAGTLAAALAAIDGQSGAAVALLREAHEEMDASSDLVTADDKAGIKAGIKERVTSRLSRIEGGAGRRMTRATGILASIGSVAPFVGLFGTVWGIMHAFIGISVAQTTNLAVVAPGIAEALLATALGLVAAIPAVVAYNALARTTLGNRQLLADASAAIEQLVSRELDRQTLAPHVAPHPARGVSAALSARHAAE